MAWSPYELAGTLIGIKETAGNTDHPLIMASLQLYNSWATHDEVPWCSAIHALICKLMGLPHSKSLAARSWLDFGTEITRDQTEPGFDFAVLKRGGDNQPGPEIRDAPGHVGWVKEFDGEFIVLRGGNQGNQYSDAKFPVERILSIRRLA